MQLACFAVEQKTFVALKCDSADAECRPVLVDDPATLNDFADQRI